MHTHTYAHSILVKFTIDVCETQDFAAKLSAETSLLKNACGSSVPSYLKQSFSTSLRKGLIFHTNHKPVLQSLQS